MLSKSKASCIDCRSQSQLLYPVSAKSSYSLWAIPALQPWKGGKGSNPSLCWQCLHTGVKALVGVHSTAEGWAGGCHRHGLCSSCVSGLAHSTPLGGTISLVGCGFSLHSHGYLSCRTYHEGLWEVRQAPDQQPGHGADRRRHGAQRQHGQRPLRHQLRVAAGNRRRKRAAGEMLLLWAQNLLLSQWGVSNRKEKIRVSGLCSYLLWSLEALVQLLMNILHL